MSNITHLEIHTQSPPLGTGGSGATVYEGTASITGIGENIPVAVKVFPPVAFAGRQQAKDAAIEEHNKLRTATQCAPDCFCIVYGYVDDERGVSIVMKKYDGTLFDELKSGQPLPLKRTVEVCIKIATTLHVLHKPPNATLFMDLKPHNILVDRAGKKVVLGDFGVARALTNTGGMTNPTNGTGGTTCYMSPEQAGADDFDDEDEPAKLTVKTDSWTFGTTMLHMLSGVAPWTAELEESGRSENWVRGRLMGRKKGPSQKLLPEGTPVKLKELVRKCLLSNPEFRPNFEQIHHQLNDFYEEFEFEEEEEETTETTNESLKEENKRLKEENGQQKEEIRNLKEENRRLKQQLSQSNSGQGTPPPASAPTPTPSPAPMPVPEEKVSSLITLTTKIELQKLKVEIEQIEEMEKNSLSPSEKRNNIDELEEKISSTEKKFQREIKILQAKQKTAKKNLDVAGKKFEFEKAEKYENERKQAEEKQVALADEHTSKVDELKQKICDEKRQLERGSEGLKRIQVKKTEYESKMRALTVGKKDGWVQEGRSLAEAVKVLDDLMERMNNLESVKEKVAREKKVREERLRQVAVETSRREAEAARKARAQKVKKENKEKKQKADREQADREKARFRKRKKYLI